MNLRLAFPTISAVLFCLLGNTISIVNAAEADAKVQVLKTFKVYHSLSPNAEFTPRGTIQFTSSADGSGSGSLESTMQHEESCLAGEDISNDMAALIASNGFYRVKIVDEQSGTSALASVPACEVRRSNFREEIGLSIGNTGSLISVSYKPVVSPLAASCHELPPMHMHNNDSDSAKELEFKSLITYSVASQGMPIPLVMPQQRPPPGYGWIKRIVNKSLNGAASGTENDGASDAPGFNPEKLGQDPQQSYSFLRKYWYIILPVSIMMLAGGEEEPAPQAGRSQGGSGGAGAGGAGAGQASAAAAAAIGASMGGGKQSVGGGGKPRQRRGKRG
eukprot:36736_1